MTRKISDPAPITGRTSLRKVAKQDQLIAQLRRRIDLLELEKEALIKRNRRLHHKLAEVEHENGVLQHENTQLTGAAYSLQERLRCTLEALTPTDSDKETEQ